MSDDDDGAVSFVLENVDAIDEPGVPNEGNVHHSIDSLSQKFLTCFESDLDKIKEKLNEVQQNQRVLVESLSQEKEKMQKSSPIDEVEAAMTQINNYRLKLCRIKKTMIALKEHSTRLNKEALKLHQTKQKENMKREDLTKKTLAEERSLEAQLSP